MKTEETIYLSTETSINNVYIHFDHLRNVSDYINTKTSFYMSNIGRKKTEVLSFLRTYAKLDTKRKFENKKNRQGYIFELMLPMDMNLTKDLKIIKQYIRSLVKNVSEGNKLHYFVVVNKIGKARMVKVVILNRVVYHDGKDVEYVRNGKLFNKTVFISTKIRLNPFATKNANSNMVFKQKMKQLKITLLKTFNKQIKEVEFFFRKLTYKKIYYAKAINKYCYVDSTMAQRDTVQELKKRKITIINILIDALNNHIYKRPQNADVEAFIEKWSNILYNHKNVKLSEINALEESILNQVHKLKIFKI